MTELTSKRSKVQLKTGSAVGGEVTYMRSTCFCRSLASWGRSEERNGVLAPCSDKPDSSPVAPAAIKIDTDSHNSYLDR